MIPEMFVFICLHTQSMTFLSMLRWTPRSGMVLTELTVKHWLFSKLNALCLLGGELQGAVQLGAVAQLWWLALEVRAEKQVLSFTIQLHKDILIFLCLLSFVIWHFEQNSKESVNQSEKRCEVRCLPAFPWTTASFFRENDIELPIFSLELSLYV